MNKKANEEHKKKLKTLLESEDIGSISQAIVLNDSLNLFSRIEIENTLVSFYKKELWKSKIWDAITTGKSWDAFCISFGNSSNSGEPWYNWLPSNSKRGWSFLQSNKPTTLEGYIAIPLAKKNESVAAYGQRLGKFIIDVEKKARAWASKQPEIERVTEIVVFGDSITDYPIWRGFIQIEMGVDIDFVAYFD